MANITYDAKARYMRDLDYETIRATCLTDRDYSKICQDKFFWERKVKKELKEGWNGDVQGFMTSAIEKQETYYVSAIIRLYANDLDPMNFMKLSIDKGREDYLKMLLNSFTDEEINFAEILELLLKRYEDKGKIYKLPDLDFVKSIINRALNTDKTDLAKISFTLGRVYFKLKNFDLKEEFWDIIIRFFEGVDDPVLATEFVARWLQWIYIDQIAAFIDKFDVNIMADTYPETQIIGRLLSSGNSESEYVDLVVKILKNYLKKHDPRNIILTFNYVEDKITEKRRRKYWSEYPTFGNWSLSPAIADVFLYDYRFEFQKDFLMNMITSTIIDLEDYSIIDSMINSKRLTIDEIRDYAAKHNKTDILSYLDKMAVVINIEDMTDDQIIRGKIKINNYLVGVCYNYGKYKALKYILENHLQQIDLYYQKSYCLRIALLNQDRRIVNLLLQYMTNKNDVKLLR